MLIESLMSVAVIAIAVCGTYTFNQFRSDKSRNCEEAVAESMAARSCRVLLELADAYQLPDELGMKKVEAIRAAKKAVLDFESDFFIQVEELELSLPSQNVKLLKPRFKI